MEELFLQILSMSITASYVILLVLVARLLLKKAPKSYSYALWSVVLFRLCCPFSFESMFSLLPMGGQAVSPSILYAQQPQIASGIGVLDRAVNAVLPPATPQNSINPMQVWVAIGAALWIAVAVGLFLYSLLAAARLNHRLKSAVQMEGNLYEVQGLPTAFVFGFPHGKIYLPAGLSDTEKSYIVRHEQTHIKRLDHLVKPLAFLVLCVHWFNPLAWVAFFICGKDMELSCDERVIKELGGGIKQDYSASLLALSTGRRIVGGCPLAFGENDTKGRIKNVLNYKKPALWVAVVAVLAVAAVSVGLLANPPTAKERLFGLSSEEYLGLEKEKSAFLALSEEEKQLALEGGTVACPQFEHLWWEESIDLSLINYVGSEQFLAWTKKMKAANECTDIYSFARDFRMDYETLAALIKQNKLEDIYPVDTIKARMNYFGMMLKFSDTQNEDAFFLPDMDAEQQRLNQEYVEPILLTGLLRRDWSIDNDASLLPNAEGQPDNALFYAFEDILGMETAMPILRQYSGKCPEKVIDDVLLSHFAFTAQQLHTILSPYYKADEKIYTYVEGGRGGGPIECAVTGVAKQKDGTVLVEYLLLTSYYAEASTAEKDAYYNKATGTLTLTPAVGGGYLYRSVAMGEHTEIPQSR